MDFQWSNNVYNGLWYDPVMEHINAFEQSINKYIEGEIKLGLYKGNISLKPSIVNILYTTMIQSAMTTAYLNRTLLRGS